MTCNLQQWGLSSTLLIPVSISLPLITYLSLTESIFIVFFWILKESKNAFYNKSNGIFLILKLNMGLQFKKWQFKKCLDMKYLPLHYIDHHVPHLLSPYYHHQNGHCVEDLNHHTQVLYMSSSFLAVGSWVTWFFSSWKRQNCLRSRPNSQNDIFFTQNDNLGPFWVKLVVILWICSALQAVLSFSAWEK